MSRSLSGGFEPPELPWSEDDFVKVDLSEPLPEFRRVFLDTVIDCE
jgi:hypothetical protein